MSATRPTIEPGFLADITDAVPSRLVRKLDKKPEAAEAWDWSEDGDELVVEAPNDVVLRLKKSGIKGHDDISCSCLLAPKCFHLLAVTSRLPLSEVGAKTPNKSGVTDVSEALPVEESATPEAFKTEVTPEEKEAAAFARDALERLMEVGLVGAASVVQGGLLRAIHITRAVGLYRLSNEIQRCLIAARQVRGSSNVQWSARAQSIGQAWRLAYLLSSRDEASLVLRGVARRRYEAQGVGTFWGICSVPFSSELGYAGVSTYVVNRTGDILALSSALPSDSGGFSTRVPAFKNATASHVDLANSSFVLSGFTRSLDHRLAGGQKVRVAINAKSTFFDGPPAVLFEVPLLEQLERALASREEPALVRKEGADLLFLDVVVSASQGVICVGERPFELVTRHNAPQSERDAVEMLGRAAGMRVRLVCRPDSIGRIVPLAVELPSGRFEFQQSAQFEKAVADAPREEVGEAFVPEPTPLISNRGYSALGRVTREALLLGRRAFMPGRQNSLETSARILRREGFLAGAEALTTLQVCAYEEGEGCDYNLAFAKLTAYLGGLRRAHELRAWTR